MAIAAFRTMIRPQAILEIESAAQGQYVVALHVGSLTRPADRSQV